MQWEAIVRLKWVNGITYTVFWKDYSGSTEDNSCLYMLAGVGARERSGSMAAGRDNLGRTVRDFDGLDLG